jgi:hypothetical protein
VNKHNISYIKLSRFASKCACPAGFEVLTEVVPLEDNDVSEEHVASIFRVEESALVPTCFTLVCFAYPLTLKKEAACSSETLVDFRQNILSYIQERYNYSYAYTVYQKCMLLNALRRLYRKFSNNHLQN